MFVTCGKEATLCAGAELSLSSYTKFLTGCDFFLVHLCDLQLIEFQR